MAKWLIKQEWYESLKEDEIFCDNDGYGYSYNEARRLTKEWNGERTKRRCYPQECPFTDHFYYEKMTAFPETHTWDENGVFIN